MRRLSLWKIYKFDLKDKYNLQTIKPEVRVYQNTSFLDSRGDKHHKIQGDLHTIHDRDLKTNKYYLTNIDNRKEEFTGFQIQDQDNKEKLDPKTCLYKIMKQDQEFADIESLAPISKIPSKKYFLI